MSTARATQPNEELDFRTSIEALFIEALGREMTPRLRERLKEAGIDLERLRPAYPRMIFSEGCRLAAEELFPRMPRDEALRILGKRTIEGYSRSMLGKAAMGVFRLIGVARGLERLTRAMRNGDNYTETRFTILGPGNADVWFNQVNGQPAFTQGLMEACMEWVGAVEPRAEILRTEGDGCVYRLTWIGK